MIKNLLLIFTLVSFLACMGACSGSNNYSETFIILINGLKVGKEVISERTDKKGNIICLTEQERDTFGSKEKKRRIIRTKIVFQDGLFPISYSYESSSGTSYLVKVEGKQIIRTLKDDKNPRVTKTPFDPNMLMFDMNAFNTISYWIRKYDVKRGGQQAFQTYLLPAVSVGRLSVIPVQIKIPGHETEKLQLKNYEIEMPGGLTMFLWVDKDNHLYRLFINRLKFEVIRSDLYERLKKIENQAN